MSSGTSLRLREALTFDDVLLEPGLSEVLPNMVDVRTKIAPDIELGIPLLSAAMDTVTEAPMAITMAQLGGLGIIHKNLEIEDQANQVRQVKKFEAGMVVNPMTVTPQTMLSEALAIMERHGISGLPVVDGPAGRLVGILTNRDVRFAKMTDKPVSELMTAKDLVTVHEGFERAEALELLHRFRIEKLLVVDEAYRLKGLITVKDIEKAQKYPNATKDAQGRLRVGAATGVGEAGLARAEALIEAGVDVLVVDTAHGHSRGVLDGVSAIRKLSNAVRVIAGNIATADGAKALMDAGADAVKVGIGPGSICTTRVVAGVGVPQLTA
ncbi:IMP dehydrogenase, partial [Geminicoccus harenae]